MRHMAVIVPELTGYASIRHVAVSLPYAAQLIDGVKYMEAKDLPRLEGTELRRARAPSLGFLVKWAQKCDFAEQLGERLKRRYDRQRQRAGLAPAGHNTARRPNWPSYWARRSTASQPRNDQRQRHHHRDEAEKNRRFQIMLRDPHLCMPSIQMYSAPQHAPAYQSRNCRFEVINNLESIVAVVPTPSTAPTSTDC